MNETNKPTVRPRYWTGTPPTACDLCGRPLGNTFVDGAIKPQGSWGFMDLRCHRMFGSGIGAGQGQLYQKQFDGRWLKMDG